MREVDRLDGKDELRSLIDTILAEVRRKAADSKVVHTDTYRDEPILRTGAELAASIAKKVAPDKYAQMRRLAGGPTGSRQYDPALFCRQARFMADHEDDYEYRGEFVQYFPTYQAMNSLQLRGYFSWRTQVRKGNVQPTSLSFAFVYIYELLNLVGEEFPQIAYERLRWFWNAYRRYDERIDNYMRQWLRDFVVYYGLERSLLDDFLDTALEDTILVLLDRKNRPQQQVFEALLTMSGYDLTRSRLYKQYPQDVQTIACDVFDQLSEYYEKHRKSTLCEKLFGRLMNGPCRLFESAVFEDTHRYEDYEYVINPLHIYRCKNGVWSAAKFYGAARKSKELGAILKTVDSAMRGPWGLPAVQPGNDTKLLAGMVQKAIEALQQRKAQEAEAARKAAEEAARPKVALDLSRLSAIRQAAAVTRDKLLVDEDADFASTAPAIEAQKEELPQGVPFAEDSAEPSAEAAGKSAVGAVELLASTFAEEPAFAAKNGVGAEERLPAVEAKASQTENQTEPQETYGLSAAEYAFLHALLHGLPWGTELKKYGLLASVAADAVNEKMFDLFGDTVIVFENDDPVLLEDYIDELKGMIPL